MFNRRYATHSFFVAVLQAVNDLPKFSRRYAAMLKRF